MSTHPDDDVIIYRGRRDSSAPQARHTAVTFASDVGGRSEESHPRDTEVSRRSGTPFSQLADPRDNTRYLQSVSALPPNRPRSRSPELVGYPLPQITHSGAAASRTSWLDPAPWDGRCYGENTQPVSFLPGADVIGGENKHGYGTQNPQSTVHGFDPTASFVSYGGTGKEKMTSSNVYNSIPKESLWKKAMTLEKNLKNSREEAARWQASYMEVRDRLQRTEAEIIELKCKDTDSQQLIRELAWELLNSRQGGPPSGTGWNGTNGGTTLR
ncbi:uncharacterized protein L203_104975 [Cryptococcus depauperatus CBS 7841]|uniref:Uncharacterized protein n=1 Tax=Cryptococcus depauperatus CBS 7841 TaxID=1295531 RepID=A0A1E3IMR6_9TREE|nr:hypothetical protein L203_01810 [Cryptococcus depauperatus CBS 7841]